MNKNLTGKEETKTNIKRNTDKNMFMKPMNESKKNPVSQGREKLLTKSKNWANSRMLCCLMVCLKITRQCVQSSGGKWF